MSKNLGVSKACPECKKTLIAAAQIEGMGKFKTKCPHCGNIILIEVGQKTTFKVTKILIMILLFSGSIYFFNGLKHTLDTIQKNTDAISNIIESWDVSLPNK